MFGLCSLDALYLLEFQSYSLFSKGAFSSCSISGLNTKLNQKKSGQIVTLIDLSARPDLQAALVHKTPEEAVE